MRLKIIGSLLLLVFIGFSINKFFVITTVNCSINQQSCPDELMHPFYGKSLFFTQIEKEINQIDQDSSIQVVSFSKKLPDTLNIELKKNPYVYIVAIGETSKVVDNNGKLLDEQTPIKDNLMTITIANEFAQQIIAENQLSPRLHQQLSLFLENLKETEIDSFTINIVNNHRLVFKVSDMPPFILDPFQLESSATTIKALLDSVELETYQTPIEEIDIRFNHVIIREITSTDGE